MGNAVGPVALIAAGIFLGYLVLTGRTPNLIATLLGVPNTNTLGTAIVGTDPQTGQITITGSGNDGTGIDRSNAGTPGVHTYTLPPLMPL